MHQLCQTRSRGFCEIPGNSRSCGSLYEPHIVTTYLVELAAAFNAWYAQEQILDGSTGAHHKLALVEAVGRTLKNGLWLLAIPAPGRCDHIFMTLAHWLVVVSAGFSVVASFAYIRDTLRGTTRPNRVSWFMWAFAPFVGSVIAFVAGADPWTTSRVCLRASPFCSVPRYFANKQSYWKLTGFDITCGTLSLLALFFGSLRDNLAGDRSRNHRRCICLASNSHQSMALSRDGNRDELRPILS